MRLLVLLVLSGVAQAQPRELKRLTSVGDDAFAHGFYGEALGAYQDAYQMTHEPSFLLKIGASYEHLGNLAEAAASYRRYAAEETALSAGERADLESRAAALERRQRSALAPSPAPVAVVATATPTTVTPPVRLVGLQRAVVISAALTAATALVAAGVTFG